MPKAIYVPATAIQGAGGKKGPQPGDPVSVTIDGVLERFEKGQAYFRPETANGVPMHPEKRESAERKNAEALNKEAADLRKQAEQIDY